MFNKIISNILPYMPKKLIWVFSKRYVAGETIEEGLKAAREMNAKGMKVTMDLLGEDIKSLDKADENKKQYIEIIRRFTSENIDGNFSVKPSMFGMSIDKEVCYNHMRDVVREATEKNNFIRVDMEDSNCVDMELDLYKKLKQEFPGHVGLVLQAYLRRTSNDLINFRNLPVNGHALNFRLCKGIYIEPADIAFKGYQEVRDQYIEDLDFMLKNGMYAGVATHDKYLVNKVMELIDKYNVPKDKYEFQMLYGITPELRQSIVDKGHKMRVYVPFGKDWFKYCTRRLKENPKVTSHIIKALFVRG